MWVYGNLYIIAGIATVVAFAQVFVFIAPLYSISIYALFFFFSAFRDFLGENP